MTFFGLFVLLFLLVTAEFTGLYFLDIVIWSAFDI